tara:strand:+ start:1546 stop:2460 length:915 start_codon:yes stop_codon:yes gene_type:complete
MSFKVWLKALRVPFITATIVPVLLGSVVAWHLIDSFNWLYFFLVLIGVSFLHFGTNLANDYYDHKSNNDEANETPTQFSGGSRVIQDGLLAPKKILYVALAFFTLGAAIGLYLSWALQSVEILLLGVVGIFFGYFYTAGPFKFGYRGFGEFIVGLCFGPLVVLGSYYVQTGFFSSTALLASIPVGILITLVLYINEFPDYNADKSVGKKTLVVAFNKQKAMHLYHFFLLLVYLSILSFILIGFFPVWTLITFITLPLAVKVYLVSKKHFNEIQELLPANAMTIALHLSIGLLLSVGFIVDKLLG